MLLSSISTPPQSKYKFLATFLLLLMGGVQRCEAQVPTVYLVDLSDARNHYVTVNMQVRSTGDETALMMPVWTPGSYLVREYARNIDSMSVTDLRGRSIEFKKIRKNRWVVQTKGVRSFRVRYRLYANEMSVRTNWVGREYAVLNGAPTFLTVPEYRDDPHVVSINFPRGWTKSATSLKADPDVAHRYIASNFDELVDSPIVAGNLHFYPFEVSGVPHVLVNVGEKGFWNGAQAATDLKKLVQAHHRMWKTIPYKKYFFLNVICDAGGGLEHDNSCLMMTRRTTFRQPSRYQSWLSLASHEFFHTWNVRRLRPQALVNYDYDNENYTPSLWIAEGVTSYYEDLLLARSGLISERDFLARFSSNIRSTQTRKGRKLQSLSQSSFDSWIKFYRPDENSPNTTVSYYAKGAVAAFLLDGEIRQATNNEKSLDDVMRELYRLYSGKRGYTPQQFRETVYKVAGKDLSDWFRVAIDSTSELDYSNALATFGLKIPGYVAPGEEDPSSRRRPWVGLRVGGDNTVASVQLNSPATTAGIQFEDELIAVNNYRLRGDFNSYVMAGKEGDQLKLILSRRGEILSKSLQISSEPVVSWFLQKQTKSSAQRKVFESWFKPKDKWPDSVRLEASGSAEQRLTAKKLLPSDSN